MRMQKRQPIQVSGKKARHTAGRRWLICCQPVPIDHRQACVRSAQTPLRSGPVGEHAHGALLNESPLDRRCQSLDLRRHLRNLNASDGKDEGAIGPGCLKNKKPRLTGKSKRKNPAIAGLVDQVRCDGQRVGAAAPLLLSGCENLDDLLHRITLSGWFCSFLRSGLLDRGYCSLLRCRCRGRYRCSLLHCCRLFNSRGLLHC